MNRSGLVVLAILIASNLVAAITVLAIGNVWLYVDANATNSLISGMIIGAIGVGASILFPYGVLRWRRNG